MRRLPTSVLLRIENPTMRVTYSLFVILIAFLQAASASGNDYEIEFSTMLGGSSWEHARDVFVDSKGDIYLVGGTRSSDFPTTEGASQRHHDKSGKRIGSGGYCDAFVCKFSASGDLIWSTLLGGPNYDRAYAVEVDDAGFVYVSGRGGLGFPVTKDAIQTEFQGTDNGIYGMQNSFVAKLKPDGSALEWASYVGVGQLCRDLSIDRDGDIYVPLHYTGKGPLPPKEWFQNGIQKSPAGGVEIGAMKIAGDGQSVRWATWFGGSGDEVPNCGLRLGEDRSVYLNFTTRSDDVPTTANVHDSTYNGKTDAFVARLAPDGSKLMFGTYFGGVGDEFGNSTHNLAVDASGNSYLVTETSGDDMPVTAGAFQKTVAGKGDVVAAKFSPTGKLMHCTYVGGSDQDGIDGVYVSKSGELIFAGKTLSSDFPVTSNAIQDSRSKQSDATIVALSPDFSRLSFCSYLGAESYDDGRSCFVDANENIYIVGSTNGPGWPAINSHQPNFAGGGGGKELCYQGGCYAGDTILAKLKKTSD
ncbi:SBBP repeat-containing protein [Mariniblastus fucicola]|uniref:Beta-propeller repeat protein n=1 Tax=Mariniblastus fucicola TaxID=980251 RepID=A0A5B9PH43_9BACT|nr:SBBP repeat-containing protein [Mariniblastus fucicola]QEG24929.1 Beta-propeller repeat protein [Mariniblastus fucicola]